MKIASIAIGLCLAWLVSEISIIRPAQDRSGSYTDRKSMFFLGLSNLAAPSLAVCAYFSGIGSVPFKTWIQVLGMALMIVGYTIRWAGMWSLKHFFSANVAVQRDHRLIIKGPYKLVRHPGYFGIWLSSLGFGLSLSNWISLLILAIFALPAFFYRIKVEERALRDAFPEYDAYAERVKTFIPFVW